MANQVLQIVGTQFVFSGSGFSPATLTDLRRGTPTTVDMTFASLANAAYINSDKFDFGATRAASYLLMAVIEPNATPSAGSSMDFWMAPSPESVADDGNPGGVDGVDGDYFGYNAAAADADEAVAQLMPVGSLIFTADNAIQVAVIGTHAPPERYSSLVMRNNSGATLQTDNVEMHIVLMPIIDEIQ